MTFKLTYHPDVKHVDLPLIDNKVRDRIKKAIEERLVTYPQHYGEPLRRTLKGYWKLRVGDYRVVFRIVRNVVRIYGIIHRKNVYSKIKNRRFFP